MKIISIDVGTSSMKTVLYDEGGHLLRLFSHEYYSEYPAPDFVEQNPLSWKKALEDVLSQMGKYCQEEKIHVDGIAVTSQRSSMIPVDVDGNPLYNAIMWQDKRTLAQCDKLIEEYGLEYFYNKTGLRINPYFVLPKIMWLREKERDIYDKAYKFIGVQDYVVYLLTGEFVTDHSQACRTMMMDIQTFSWDKELIGLGGITPEKLPKLVSPGTIGGGLIKELAELAKLEENLPVILSGGDQQNAAVALGVTKKGRAEANTGTGSFVISAIDEPHFDENCRVLCQASALEGKWIMEAGIFNTGAVYRWFKNTFYPDLEGKENAYTIMNEEAKLSLPGANGIIIIPHFQGSAAPYWNPNAKGVFFNLSLDDKRGDFTRAILEGISVEIANNLRLIQQLTGNLDLVSVAGGMTRADLFCEIQANTYNRKVVRYENSEATSLGAAMIAAISLGFYKDIDEAAEKMTGSDPVVFNPDSELAEIYEKVFMRKMVLYDAIRFGDVYQAFK